MASPANILVLIHGMSPEIKPSSPFARYESFWKALVTQEPALEEWIQKRIGIQWGHEMPSEISDIDHKWGYVAHNDPEKERPDQKLTKSQGTIRQLVSYETLRNSPSLQNKLLTGWQSDLGAPLLRAMLVKFREGMVVPGIGDVVYYCSEEGERRIRAVVYHQILRGLDSFLDQADVRFHIFAHSMGVILAHDFLYGLFAPDREPDFIKDKQGSELACEYFGLWRKKAQAGEVKLGSLASAASQLPLFLMRKEKFIEQFYKGDLLDPEVIGVVSKDRVQWKIFYDVDDPLGFASRRLYKETPAIMDIQVNCGWHPEKAHIGYWGNDKVIRETADLIRENCVL